MKTLHIKTTMDADEFKAVQAMCAALRLTVNEYIMYAARLGHAKLVADINAALSAAKQEAANG